MANRMTIERLQESRGPVATTYEGLKHNRWKRRKKKKKASERGGCNVPEHTPPGGQDLSPQLLGILLLAALLRALSGK